MREASDFWGACFNEVGGKTAFSSLLPRTKCTTLTVFAANAGKGYVWPARIELNNVFRLYFVVIVATHFYAPPNRFIYGGKIPARSPQTDSKFKARLQLTELSRNPTPTKLRSPFGAYREITVECVEAKSNCIYLVI
jgi:hypothetical protein